MRATLEVVSGYEEGLPQAFLMSKQDELVNFELLTIVEVINQTIFGRSLIGTDKHYETDALLYSSPKEMTDIFKNSSLSLCNKYVENAKFNPIKTGFLRALLTNDISENISRLNKSQ